MAAILVAPKMTAAHVKANWIILSYFCLSAVFADPEVVRFQMRDPIQVAPGNQTFALLTT
ncbi:hypothetical protein [Metallibacterium sp.]|uniref:hypothetical protein n=1 Tax=Metallibacterium sp. TaxID=2940281 RepID=UPI00262E69C4|nr:hypothetical protein [Metallibacterium sp.]